MGRIEVVDFEKTENDEKEAIYRKIVLSKVTKISAIILLFITKLRKREKKLLQKIGQGAILLM